MDRDKIVGNIISTFSRLRVDATKLFSEKSIIEKAEIMIEEFFELKFIPYIIRLKKEIISLPPDDYTIIAIDSWLKELNKSIIDLSTSNALEGYAEVRYIQQKYIPKLVETLKDTKLEILETHFSFNGQDKKQHQPFLTNSKTLLSQSAIAYMFTQLYNFNAISRDISIEEAIVLYCNLMGGNNDEVSGLILHDSESHRLTSKVTIEDLQLVSKLMKSILARTESDIQKTVK
jgi:hypothetical protein